MAMNVSIETTECYRCGKSYPKKKGYFPVSYSALNKGVGYTHICKACVDALYESYLSKCDSPKMALRQVCRKLDLYWDDALFEDAEKKSARNSLVTSYLIKLTSTRNAGKSYDDTLANEGTLWDFAKDNMDVRVITGIDAQGNDGEGIVSEIEGEPVDEEVVAFWGIGYSAEMYRQLEQRRSYWMGKFPEGTELDIGTEAIIRQLCSLELDINRDRAAGKPVDKSVNALNTLLGSANLKPVQKKQEDNEAEMTKTPMGMWLYRWENKRPLPDGGEDSRILKYVFTWMGHLCKMLNVKGNKYTKLYEDEIAKYTVDKPEYDDEEEAFLDELENTPDYSPDPIYGGEMNDEV